MNLRYQEYLKSDDWKAKRELKLASKKSPNCEICHGWRFLHVHHLIYRENLEDTKQGDLAILCLRCHDLTHELMRQGKLKFQSSDPHTRFIATYRIVTAELGMPIDPEKIRPTPIPLELRKPMVDRYAIPPGMMPLMVRDKKDHWIFCKFIQNGSLRGKQLNKAMFTRYDRWVYKSKKR